MENDISLTIIDNFFADRPIQLKPIRTKTSQCKPNNDRSVPLKRDRRSKPTTEKSYQSEKANVIKFDRTVKKVELIPRNAAQEDYVGQLLDPNTRICIAVGPAGCGKTYIGVQRAIMALRNHEVDKIIITRPAVSVDEQHGFLPGDLNEKMAPWVRPVMDIFEEYYGKSVTAQMVIDGTIEVAPLAYMRGRSFKYCFILAEEVQNCTPEQSLMLTTRMGVGCTMVITGDLRQHDRGFDKNGLSDLISKVESGRPSKAIRIAKFNKSHVERDPIVSEILGLYGEE